MRFYMTVAFLLLSSACFAETTIYFPQIADGAGYQTTVTIFNPGKTAVTGTLQFYTPQGTAWSLSVNSKVNSDFAVSLPASGSARFRTEGTALQVKSGWASLRSTDVLVGVATYDFRSQGILSETVGVLGTPSLKTFMIPADCDSYSQEDLGIAIVNTSDSRSLTVNLSLLDERGNLARTSTDPEYQLIGPHGYVAKYVGQAFPSIPLIHKGTLLGEVSGDGTMAVIGIVLKDRTQSVIPVSTTLIKGETIAWGNNDGRQTDVPVDAQSGISAVAAGGNNSLALKDGRVIYWGSKTTGLPIEVPVEAQSGVTAIASGLEHNLAIKDGRVIAWGVPFYGATDVPMEAQSGVNAIATTYSHNLALKNGRVIAWGLNNAWQSDVPVEAQSGVSAVAGGHLHSLALKDGRVIAWGYEMHGASNVPAEAQSGVSAIAAGGSHSLALKNGRVIVWGSNEKGQLNVPVEAQSGVSAIAAGADHSLALKNGRVIAWGSNEKGQLNVPLEAQSGVSAIAAGYYHSLALK